MAMSFLAATEGALLGVCLLALADFFLGMLGFENDSNTNNYKGGILKWHN